ncbi:MAG: hypothetical protein P8L71_05295 [Flavobacteriales bacterium]|nr:hypothetical protein [Flavobacteriales bacterium]
MNKNLRLFYILIVLSIGAGILWYMNTTDQGELKPQGDFAIADTASIGKIVISDADQNVITLERASDSRFWDLNKDYKAREDAVNLILKTVKLIQVKTTVPQTQKENVIRQIAIGKRVDFYDLNGDPIKTYFVGTSTQDHTGTYMVLEKPEEGRSSEPFIMQMQGFTGFLTTRFFTDFEEWRYTGIFDFPELDFKKVEVLHHEHPERSFEIEYNGGNDLKLKSVLLDKYIPNFDTLRVKDYLLLYKKVHLETHKSYLGAAQEDSLINSNAAYTLGVTNKDGLRKKVDLYWKNPISVIMDANGQPEKWDMARIFGVVKGDDVTLCQRFVTDPLTIGISAFMKQD